MTLHHLDVLLVFLQTVFSRSRRNVSCIDKTPAINLLANTRMKIQTCYPVGLLGLHMNSGTLSELGLWILSPIHGQHEEGLTTALHSSPSVHMEYGKFKKILIYPLKSLSTQKRILLNVTKSMAMLASL